MFLFKTYSNEIASKNLRDYDKIMEIREEIGTSLRQYMFGNYLLN